MGHSLTSEENIALRLIFEWLDAWEPPINRTFEAYAAHLPKLAALHAYVNQRLQEMAKAGDAPYEICSFKAGDKYWRYKQYPTSVSITTVRNALVKSGMWQLRASLAKPLDRLTLCSDC
jgi:type II secretory pathway component PulM